jgi:uncharacterized protein YjbI with pentapeptide repeats
MSQEIVLRTLDEVAETIVSISIDGADRIVWANLRECRIASDQSQGLRRILVDLDTDESNGWSTQGDQHGLPFRRYPNLNRSVLEGVDLSTQAGEKPVNLSRVFCIETKLSGSNLSRVRFESAFLSDADLSQANITQANFTRASLCDAQLGEATATGTIFAYAALMGAIAVGLKAKGADFSDANLYDANLAQAFLQEAKFHRANLFQTSFSGADLTNAKFVGVELFWTNFSGADLKGVDFTGSIVMNADFTGAKNIDPSQLTSEQIRHAKGLTPEFIEAVKAIEDYKAVQAAYLTL